MKMTSFFNVVSAFAAVLAGELAGLVLLAPILRTTGGIGVQWECVCAAIGSAGCLVRSEASGCSLAVIIV